MRYVWASAKRVNQISGHAEPLDPATHAQSTRAAPYRVPAKHLPRKCGKRALHPRSPFLLLLACVLQPRTSADAHTHDEGLRDRKGH